MSNKLKAFIAMLASDQPGEVANAAAMLVKHLKADGKDLHWLANLAAGERPAAPPHFASSGFSDINKMMQFMQRITELQAENARLLADRRRLQGEIAGLRHENDMLSRARAQNGPAEPFGTATSRAQAKARAKAGFPHYGPGPGPGWDSNPFGGQTYSSQQHWRDMAEYAFIHGDRCNCLSFTENDFLLTLIDRPRDYVLTYKQQSWLQDIYDRVRRVEAAKGY
jgi:hypothetical protein